jgi:hypothetical protein
MGTQFVGNLLKGLKLDAAHFCGTDAGKDPISEYLLIGQAREHTVHVVDKDSIESRTQFLGR